MADRTNEVPGDAGYDPDIYMQGMSASGLLLADILTQLSNLRKQIALLETKVNMLQNKIGGLK